MQGPLASRTLGFAVAGSVQKGDGRNFQVVITEESRVLDRRWRCGRIDYPGKPGQELSGGERVAVCRRSA